MGETAWPRSESVFEFAGLCKDSYRIGGEIGEPGAERGLKLGTVGTKKWVRRLLQTDGARYGRPAGASEPADRFESLAQIPIVGFEGDRETQILLRVLMTAVNAGVVGEFREPGQ